MKGEWTSWPIVELSLSVNKDYHGLWGLASYCQKIKRAWILCSIRIWAWDGHLVEPSFKYLWYLNSVNPYCWFCYGLSMRWPNQVSYTIFAMDWDHTVDSMGWQIVCPIRVLQNALTTQIRTHADTHMHLIYTLMAKGVMITIETQFSDNHTSSSILFSPVNHIAFQTCSQCSTTLMIGSLYFELPLNISFTFGELWDS